ncbi:MAG: hypothetical protein QOK47_1592, partial [Actinomycetota bacterium]|nr:hypothetical protein [Actinomycetota bacterium]
LYLESKWARHLLDRWDADATSLLEGVPVPTRA